MFCYKINFLPTENGENLISAQPQISAHPESLKIKQAPWALNRINVVSVIVNDNKDLIPRRKTGLIYKSLFTLVVTCTCIDIDVTENRADYREKAETSIL